MTTAPLHPDTLLVHPSFEPAPGFKSLAQPIHMGSTVLFDSLAAFDARDSFDESRYVYGTVHTPTTLAVSKQVAQIEGGHNAVLAPSGLAAIHLALMSVLQPGDHVLIPDNAYHPVGALGRGLLQRMHVQMSTYDPMDLNDVQQQMRPNTRVVWVEAPGSVTMEICDVPAIAKIAHEQGQHAQGTLVVMDNTWSAGRLFKPFVHGVDMSVQALTKYHGGHGDVLMGAVIAKDQALWRNLKDHAMQMGVCVGPHDCSLVLRGIPTMAMRMAHVGQVAQSLAQWLVGQTGVRTVLHPALPSCPGHEVFQRDFSGAAGLFSIELEPHLDAAAIERMCAAMPLFKIGASWGGTTSLILAYQPGRSRRLERYKSMGRVVRLNIGFEAQEDLQANLSAGLAALNA